MLTPVPSSFHSRERNRMHAKMTRDRKKGFIAAIEKTIEHLESNNEKMRAALTQVAKHHFGPNAITPQSSPLVTGMTGNMMTPVDIQDKMSSPILRPFAITPITTIKPHRVPHGFSITAP
jgi:ribosomal protein S19